MPLGDASFALLLGGCQVGLDPGDTVAGYRSPVDAEGRQGKQTMQSGGRGAGHRAHCWVPPPFSLAQLCSSSFWYLSQADVATADLL